MTTPSLSLPRLTLVYLYPRRMNLYADRGNVRALERRYAWRGGAMDIIPVEVGEPLPEHFDLLFMGGGEDRAQAVVAPDLLARKNALEDAVIDGTVMLGICGGYQLFGRSYQVGEAMMPGVGLLDVETRSSASRRERMIGNVAAEIDWPALKTTLIGFENHGGQTTLLAPETIPLGKVIAGYGNNRADSTEGARKGTVFGSYLHGSLLPKNPAFADFLLHLAVRRHGEAAELATLDDGIEDRTRTQIMHDVLPMV